MTNLFSNPNSYDVYIFAPAFKRASAGHTCQYLLCDNLNRLGIQTWIVPDMAFFGVLGYSHFAGYGNLITPVLSRHSISRCAKEGRIPIVIYPESMSENPLCFNNVVRYLFYYNKVLNGVDALGNISNEGVLYYSNSIGRESLKNYPAPLFAQRLTLPVQDPRKYKISRNRSGVYYYGEKHICLFNRPIPQEIARKAIRITRDHDDSPSPNQLVQLLSTAKLLHVFEDTALIYEALLGGCVVNIHPSGSYGGTTATATPDELGSNGTISKHNVTESDIVNAQKQLKLHAARYQEWIKLAQGDIRLFINNLNVFKSGYTPKLQNALYSIVDQLDKYDRSMIVTIADVHPNIATAAHVYLKSITRRYFRYFKNIIPVTIKKLMKDNIRYWGRKCPSAMQPYLRQCYSYLLRL